MQYVDELTVLVCTVQREPIPGLLRYEWMKTLLPDAKVVHVTDEVPSYPHESEDFWPIWTKLLQRENPEAEVFFSSEDYGDEVAERLNIDHVIIDKKREKFPVSATAIRNDPFANWHFIPDNVKPYYVRKIVLTGPESTGKTTMAQALSAHFQTVWVEEYGRNYFVERGGVLTLEDFPAIAKGQIELEENALQHANKFLFCDTDVLVTQIWSEVYFGTYLPEVEAISRARQYDLYLLLDIDIPWEDDGTREFPHLRTWHFNRIKQELDARNLNYKIISGDLETRMKMAVESCERLSPSSVLPQRRKPDSFPSLRRD